MMDLRIDPELKSLIPPLTSEEREGLERSIIDDGIRDPIIVWLTDSGERIIVDGHNRYEIATKHGLTFTTTQREFQSKQDVINWMIDNQLGRRNLDSMQKSYLLGKRYLEERSGHGGDRKSEKSKGQNDLLISTAEKIADQYGISEKTVKRAGKFAEAIDRVNDIIPCFREDVLSGETGLKKYQIEQLASIPESDIPKVVDDMKKEYRVAKTIRYAMNKIRYFDRRIEKKEEISPEEYQSFVAMKELHELENSRTNCFLFLVICELAYAIHYTNNKGEFTASSIFKFNHDFMEHFDWMLKKLVKWAEELTAEESFA